jgi:hypothetical protein
MLSRRRAVNLTRAETDQWRDRDEYTDLGGGTQLLVIGHWSIVISHSPWKVGPVNSE